MFVKPKIISDLKSIRKDISEGRKVREGFGDCVLRDAIEIIDEESLKHAHQIRTDRGLVQIVGVLTEGTAYKLGFSPAFTDGGRVFWSRITSDVNHREFVFVDNTKVSWLDETKVH